MKKRKRRRYTDEERATFVTMLESEGYPKKKNGALARVAKYAKVPESTLRGWYHKTSNPPPAKLRAEKRRTLAELFEEAAHVYIEHATKADVVEDTTGNQAMTAAAIAVDKMRLLQGLPTEIISTIHDLYITLEERGYDAGDVFNRWRQKLDNDNHIAQ